MVGGNGTTGNVRSFVSQITIDPAPAQLPAPASRRIGARAWLAVASMSNATVAVLRAEGRVWWCACRTPTPFSTNPNSRHNSQHLLDPYSFSHLLHGLIFYGCLRLIAPRARPARTLLVALAIEAGWEILENSPLIIARYRAATAAVGYTGDSIVNSSGDVLSCALGFWLASRLSWRWSLAIFVAVELIMLALIRDNLTLNVVMLLYPLDAIRQWQSGG
jgi:hypothetical protein